MGDPIRFPNANRGSYFDQFVIIEPTTVPAQAAVPVTAKVPVVAGPPSWVAVGAAPGARPPPQGLLAPKSTVDEALKAGVTPAASSPYMRHLDWLQKNLAQSGLPTSAEGVRVVVVGEGKVADRALNDHAQGVLQVISGRIGLAQKAEVEVALDPHVPSFSAMSGGSSMKLADVGAVGRAAIIRAIASRQRQLGEIVSRLPPHAPTTLVNMSNGLSMATVLRGVLTEMEKAPAGSPLHREVSQLLGHPFKGEDQADVKTLGTLFGNVLRAELSSPQVLAAQRALENDVAVARAHGVLVFKAAGNDRNKALLVGRASDWKQVDTVEGMISVGAIDLGPNPTDSRDDKVAPFSVEGPVLGAVGMQVPLRSGDASGTTYTTPFALSVAALMLKANPRLRPDDLERILKSTSFSVGDAKLKQVDVVRAVAMAAHEAKTTAKLP